MALIALSAADAAGRSQRVCGAPFAPDLIDNRHMVLAPLHDRPVGRSRRPSLEAAFADRDYGLTEHAAAAPLLAAGICPHAMKLSLAWRSLLSPMAGNDVKVLEHAAHP